MMRLSDALKFWGWLLLALVCIAVGARFADSLIYRPNADAGTRWLGVALAVACWVPMLIVVGFSIQLGDEYQRQVFLVGIALGFGAFLLFLIGFSATQEAGLIPTSVRPAHLATAVGAWAVGTAASALYHRMRR